MVTLKVLDLFAGLGGWSAPWTAAGHEVTTVDLDPRFGSTFVGDVLAMAPSEFRGFDVVLASPPCEAFSVASIGTHWAGGLRAYEPATEHAQTSLALVHWTLAVVEATRPRYWVIENPRGMLRQLQILDRYERNTVSFCHYGDSSMKPTDLWGGFPDAWHPRPMCHNQRPEHPASCCCRDHESAPRGAKTGTQGKQGAAARAEIPLLLARDLMESIMANEAAA